MKFTTILLLALASVQAIKLQTKEAATTDAEVGCDLWYDYYDKKHCLRYGGQYWEKNGV